jgi:hypothetical protein
MEAKASDVLYLSGSEDIVSMLWHFSEYSKAVRQRLCQDLELLDLLAIRIMDGCLLIMLYISRDPFYSKKICGFLNLRSILVQENPKKMERACFAA